MKHIFKKTTLCTMVGALMLFGVNTNAQVNDDCANAKPIACGTTESGNTDAATSDDAANNQCDRTTDSPGVWYSFTGTGQDHVLDLSNSDFDTYLSLYSGTCAALVCVDWDDDGGSGTTSKLEFLSTLGTNYLILVRGYGGFSTGDFELSLSCTDLPQVANDLCVDAITIACNTTEVGSTSLATADGAPFCMGIDNTSPGVWYTFTGNGDDIELSTINSSAFFDTKLSVYTGSCTGLICEVANDDWYGSKAAVFFTSVNSEDYYILVHGFGGQTGDYALDLICTPQPPPANDDCGNAIPIACGGSASGNTDAATFDDAANNQCNRTTESPGVWYSFTGTGQDHVVSLNNLNFDSYLSLYSGTCAALVCVDYSDPSSFEFQSTLGTDYLLLVRGWSGSSTGDFELNLSCTDIPLPPANDFCDDAISIACGGLATGNTDAATLDSAPFCDYAYQSPGVWYSFIGTGEDHVLTVTGYDTRLTIYVDGCGTLTCVEGDDDGGPGLGSQIEFTSTTGVEYLFLVHGYFSSFSGERTGPYELTLNCLPNDDCSGALDLVCGTTVIGTTDAATEDNAPICNSIPNTSAGVWYTFEGNGDDHVISLVNPGTNFDTRLTVYEGSCNVLNCVTANDDHGGLQSEVSFTSNIGDDYYVLVHGFGSSTGNYELSFVCTPQPPPANDECFNAIAIACGGTATGSTVTATFDDAGTCVTSNTGPGVWYSVIGDGNTIVAGTDNPGSDYDTKLSVYTAPSGNCAVGLECVTGDDDGGDFPFSNKSVVQFGTVAGQEYLILVHGFSTRVGDYELSVNCFPPPTNDDGCDALLVGIGTTSFSNEFASAEIGEPNPGEGSGGSSCDSQDGWCSADTDVQNSVWFNFVMPNTGCISIAVTSTDFFNNQVTLWEVSDCSDYASFVEIAANDNSGDDIIDGAYFSSAGLFPTACLTPGELYWIQVDGYNGDVSTDATLHLIDCGSEIPIALTSTGGCQSSYDGYAPIESDTNFLQVCATGGVAPYTFSKWERVGEPGVYPAGLYEVKDETCTNLAVTPDVTTFYTVTVTDALGCTESIIVEVFVIDLDCSNNPNSTKIELCHDGRTLCVSADAVEAHLAHGDVIGECGNPCLSVNPPFYPPPADAEICTETPPGGEISSSLPPLEDVISVPPNGGLQVTDLNVYVQLEHSWLGDLEITLTSPSGTSVILYDRDCGSEDDMDVLWDDAAATSVDCASPTVGTYIPSEALAAFNDEIYEGDWTLTVDDQSGGDNGVLLSWCMDPELQTPPPDCLGVVGGDNYPGDACDDGDPLTFDDRWSEDCICIGSSVPLFTECTPTPGRFIESNETLSDVITMPANGGLTVSSITVNVDITHSWSEDLDLELVSPSGIRVTLLVGSVADCGSTDMENGVIYDDAGAAYLCGSAGTFALVNSDGTLLADFNGEGIEGVWTLNVTDNAGGDQGDLNDWCLNIEANVPASTGAGATAPISSIVGGELEATITAFPNPTSGITNMQFNVPQAGNVDIALYTLDGRKVAQIFNGNVEAGAVNMVDFNVADLPSGIYIYQMITSNDILSNRLQIVR